MAKKKHGLLELLGLGAAAFAGYKFVYEPWRLNQDALATSAAGGAVTPTYTDTGVGGLLSAISAPAPSVGTSYPITPSNLDPGAAVGGAVGACMHKKGLTQSDCTARLQKIVAAIQAAQTQLASLQSGSATANLQAFLTANQAAVASDQANITAATARKDTGAVASYKAALAAHQANVTSAAQQLAQIPGQITAIQAAIAGAMANYTSYTGLQYAG